MYIILLFLGFGGIVLFEAPGLIYQKYWRELIFFFLFLGLAFTLSLLAVIGIKLPSPAEITEKIVTFFLKPLSKLF